LQVPRGDRGEFVFDDDGRWFPLSDTRPLASQQGATIVAVHPLSTI